MHSLSRSMHSSVRSALQFKNRWFLFRMSVMATLTSNRMCAPRSQGDISTRFFSLLATAIIHCVHTRHDNCKYHMHLAAKMQQWAVRGFGFSKAQQMKIWSKVCHLKSGSNGGVESQHVHRRSFYTPSPILCVTNSSATSNRSQYVFAARSM